MIRFDSVQKWYRTPFGVRHVLRRTDLDIPFGTRLGVLGANGVGKSTLIRLIAGVEYPSEGLIRRRCRVSFPLGFGGTFHPKLSGRENVMFIARLYGADVRRVLASVSEFAELGAYFRMPLETYSSGMVAKLAFGACLAIDFDVFLIDEVTAVGDARFAERCRAAFDTRVRRSNMIMVSHNMNTIREYCDRGALLVNGQLTIFSDLDSAIKAHERLMRSGTARAMQMDTK